MTAILSWGRWVKSISLETKDCQFDNFVVIGGTVSCHYDNLRCHEWQQNCQTDNLLFSVKTTPLAKGGCLSFSIIESERSSLCYFIISCMVGCMSCWPACCVWSHSQVHSHLLYVDGVGWCHTIHISWIMFKTTRHVVGNCAAMLD